MRENFDYVTMETYSADMAENTQRALSAIMTKQYEMKLLHRMIWMLARASGGEVKITHDVQYSHNDETAVLVVERMAHDMSIVVRAE